MSRHFLLVVARFGLGKGTLETEFGAVLVVGSNEVEGAGCLKLVVDTSDAAREGVVAAWRGWDQHHIEIGAAAIAGHGKDQ